MTLQYNFLALPSTMAKNNVVMWILNEVTKYRTGRRRVALDHSNKNVV